ncbi:MAG TPA: SdrD B-like domain-containing protein, partial [bacterium]|nr:SdrD B-like domain-containing protein [bacterium]
ILASKTVVSAGPYQAGSSVVYLLSLTNTGASTAYDLQVTDTLDPVLSYVGTTPAPDSPPAVSRTGSTLLWGQAPGWDLAPGASLHFKLTVTASVSAQPGQSISNSFSATWASLPSGSGGRRNGAGGVDDYVTGTAAAVVTINQSGALTKTRTSAAATSLGSTVSYRLVYQLTEGTTQRVNVLDSLPAGEAFQGVTITVGKAGITYTPVSQPAAGATGALAWAFNNVVDPADGNSAGDTLQLDYGTSLSLYPGYSGADLLSNTAQVTYIDALGALQTVSPVAATVQVLAPTLKLGKSVQALVLPLAPGGTLRYTLTLSNTGAVAANGITLVDDVPARTAYIPGSTKLNGVVLPDVAGGLPLIGGLSLSPPGLAAGQALTVVFDAAVNSGVANGTVISNQALAQGPALPTPVPSGDPSLPGTNPTRIVVGSAPSLQVIKSVQDLSGTPTVGGHLLQYQLWLRNLGSGPATNVALSDTVPAGTTYAPGSAQASTGSAQVLGNALSWSLPSLPAGLDVTVSFNVVVNPGLPAGTVLSNQAVVSSAELPPKPSDSPVCDGGCENPTDIVVGFAPALTLYKTVADLSGGAVKVGDTLSYQLTFSNVGVSPAANVVLTDNQPSSGASYVTGSVQVDGQPVADVGAQSPLASGLSLGTVAPGQTVRIAFEAQVSATAAAGQTISNLALYTAAGGLSGTSSSDLGPGQPAQVQVGGAPGTAALSGTVWIDGNFNGAIDPNESRVPGWTVEVLQGATVVSKATTDANGYFSFAGLAPGPGYSLALVHPTSKLVYRVLGPLTLQSGSNLINNNIPLDPSGVVYNSVTRKPLAGAVVSIRGPAGFNPLTNLVSPAEQGQATAADGYYQFLLVSPPAGDYFLSVSPPAGYSPAFPSAILPPHAGPLVGLPSPATVQDVAVGVSQAPQAGQSTLYYLEFDLAPGDAAVVDNNLPLDPVQAGSILLTKSVAKTDASVGDLVPYTLQARNLLSVSVTPLAVVDRIPGGFKYVPHSARVDGVAAEPKGTTTLRWGPYSLSGSASVTITYLLAVGAGVADGSYRNQAQVDDANLGTMLSNLASASVSVVGEPLFEESLIVGKVFRDDNGNGRQDPGEPGLAGVRIASLGGVLVTTDAHGRYHLDDVDVADVYRGQQELLKVDEHTLPQGCKVASENPRLLRLTQGLMQSADFAVDCDCKAPDATLLRRINERLRVLFRPCEAEPTEEGLAQLTAFLQRIQHPRHLEVTLQGDSLCPGQDEAALRKAREQVIRKALADGLGLDANALVIHSAGATSPTAATPAAAPAATPIATPAAIPAKPSGLQGGLPAGLGRALAGRWLGLLLAPDRLPAEPVPLYAPTSPSAGAAATAASPDASALAQPQDVVSERVGQTVTLRPHFVSGRSEVASEDLQSIQDIAAKLDGRIGEIRVSGHTDNQRLSPRTRALYGDNNGLSRARAQAVLDILLKALQARGIPLPEKVEALGFGPDRPVAGNDTPEGMALNRRVEVELITYVKEHMRGVALDVVGEVAQPVTETACLDLRPDPLSPRRALNLRLQAPAQEGRGGVFLAHCDYAFQVARFELSIQEAGLGGHELRLITGPAAALGRPILWDGLDASGATFTAGTLLQAQLSVYDADGRRDRTVPRAFEIGARQDAPAQLPRELGISPGQAPEQQDYDMDDTAERGIPLGGVAVAVQLAGAKPLGSVSATAQALGGTAGGLAGDADRDGRWAAQPWLGADAQQLELDYDGPEHPVSRAEGLKLLPDEFFSMGLADATVGWTALSGDSSPLQGSDLWENGLFGRGRLAFYTKARWDQSWLLTAQMDTGEDASQDLFSTLGQADPRRDL